MKDDGSSTGSYQPSSFPYDDLLYEFHRLQIFMLLDHFAAASYANRLEVTVDTHNGVTFSPPKTEPHAPRLTFVIDGRSNDLLVNEDSFEVTTQLDGQDFRIRAPLEAVRKIRDREEDRSFRFPSAKTTSEEIDSDDRALPAAATVAATRPPAGLIDTATGISHKVRQSYRPLLHEKSAITHIDAWRERREKTDGSRTGNER